MPNLDINSLKYTSDELLYFEKEMLKYRLPWISKVWKTYGVQFLRYTFLPALIIIAIFGAIYGNSAYGQNEWMWVLDKSIALFYLIGFGLFTVTSRITEFFSTNKLRKRLNLSRNDFNIMVIAFQITGME